MASQIEPLLKNHPILPVVTIYNTEHAVPLANALAAGGIHAIEVTLRSPQGLSAIELIRKQCPNCLVGAGTVINASLYHDAITAGAQFIVSPGMTQNLLQMAQQHAVPFLPGIMTASEILEVFDSGLTTVKLFPAQLAGGLNAIKHFSAVFPEINFCPTGGIKLDNMLDYLSHPRVIAIGGSWLAPRNLCDDQSWDRITELATVAVSKFKAQSSVEN